MVITPELTSQVPGPKTQGGPLLRASLSYLLSTCSVPCREAEEPVPRPDTVTVGGRVVALAITASAIRLKC